MAKNKYCLIYNFAQHYRIGIFKELEDRLGCDFYFGDRYEDVKKADYSELNNVESELKNIYIYKNIYWQKGAISLFFRSYDVYIVLGEYYCITTWILLLLSRFSHRKKVFLWTHGWYGNENFIKHKVKKIFYQLGDGILLYGSYAKNLMINLGFDQNKLHVIYNSLDYYKQLEIRNSLLLNRVYANHFNNSDPTLLFIGRLTKVKKLDLLIRAIKKLVSNNFCLNLVLVGDGLERKKLEGLVNDLELQSTVWFYGSLYDEREIGNMIYNADLCVSPGNVGLTAIHCLSYGTPVVTHDNFANQMPEFEAIVPGVTGDFFQEDNLSDLCLKIENWILDNSNRRQYVRAECYKVIDTKFNPRYQAEIIENAVNDVL